MYHKRTKSLIDGLSWRQLRSLIPTIVSEDVPFWLVWREGEPEWTELQKRLSSILNEPVSQLVIPPIAPLTPAEPEDDEDEEAGTLSAIGTLTKTRPALSSATQSHTNPGIDRRMTKRFNKVVPVVIDVKGKTFFSQTKNISVLGIKLASDVPFEINGTFKLTLMIKPEPMELTCQLNRNEKGTSLSQLRILPNDEINRLAEYLLLQD